MPSIPSKKRKIETNHQHYFCNFSKCSRMEVRRSPFSMNISVYELTGKQSKRLIKEFENLAQYQRWLASEYDDGTIKFED